MSTISLKGREWKLPSMGRFYKDMPLINGESVILRPLLAGDQRHLVAGGDSYSSYTTLLSRVIVEPKGLDFNQFLLEDINSIVFGVRVLSFGTLYKMPFLCQDCGALNRAFPVMLDTVEMTFAEELPNIKTSELEIEVAGKKLTYHLPTLNDERLINSQINVFRRQKRLKDETVDRLFITLCQKIDTIDGKDVNFEEKFTLLENLSQDEFESLSEQLKAFTFGLAGTVAVTCDSCQTSQDAGLVITPDFFHTNK